MTPSKNYKAEAEKWLEKNEYRLTGLTKAQTVESFARHLDSEEKPKECEHKWDSPFASSKCSKCGVRYTDVVLPPKEPLKRIEPLGVIGMMVNKVGKDYSFEDKDEFEKVYDKINELCLAFNALLNQLEK